MNINEYVYVKLSAKGKEIADACEPYDFYKLDNGWTAWQLWMLIKTFGEHVNIGNDTVFEDNQIHFEKPDDS